jgi:RimJ/RimL family protein N-acetyltransferase
MAETILETDRLILRSWDDADIDPFMTHLNTPAVMRWLGPLQTRADMEMRVTRVNACQAEHGHCFWLLERKADGALLGFCGIKRVDAAGTDLTGEFEVGWRLREDAWGQGYAKEAAIASILRAFDVHGASRVVAFTVQGNTASWGLMEKLGMVRRDDLAFSDPAYDDPELNPTIVYVTERNQWTA